MTTARGTLVVTGATGRVGGRVARRLAAAGVGQRLVVRAASRAPALAGAEVMAAETPDRIAVHTSFVDAVVDAGVKALVYLSFAGAAADATFTLARDHWATEQHIRRSGLRFTVLRDNMYADFAPLLVGEDGVIRGPGGDGRAAVVAQDDIADVAVRILEQPEPHEGVTYDLTGPEAVSFAEVAAVLTRATGRTVMYQAETVEEAYASRAHYGAPPWQVEAWVSTYLAVAAGELAEVSDAVPRIAGHPARTLAQVLSG